MGTGEDVRTLLMKSRDDNVFHHALKRRDSYSTYYLFWAISERGYAKLRKITIRFKAFGANGRTASGDS